MLLHTDSTVSEDAEIEHGLLQGSHEFQSALRYRTVPLPLIRLPAEST